MTAEDITFQFNFICALLNHSLRKNIFMSAVSGGYFFSATLIPSQRRPSANHSGLAVDPGHGGAAARLSLALAGEKR
jgi:hypothetical protein